MVSQLERLRRSLARIQANGAASSSPMVQGLRMQIMAAERAQRRRETGGFFDDQGKIKPEWQNPVG